MLEIIVSTLILVICGYLIAKNYDAKIVLFGAGLLLMFAAVGLGHPLLPAAQSSGLSWLDPFVQIKQIFISQMGNVGLTIMVLFGFSSYMSHIGANDVTVMLLTRPLSRIRSPYLLVPVIFLLGNLLSLVVPSAASLAVLLMATLYPVLKASNMSSLTAGAVIATTATIMPSPLGADNVLAAQKLGIPLVEYIVSYHAPISLPTLALMAVVHYFWQKAMDKRQQARGGLEEKEESLAVPTGLPPAYYGLFPVLPLVLVLLFGICFTHISLGLVEITFVCLLLTIGVELLRKGNIKETSKEFAIFFTGMGTGLAQVVSLIVAASMLVEGLKAIGIIDTLVDSVKHIDGVGSILMFFFSGTAALIGFISGSGLAVFYSFINIIPEITEKVGVNSVAVALPMQLTANLIRSMSPVAAVIIVIASITGSNPIEIIKRTSVPIISGIICCMTLSYLLFS
ncbi:C4-dicarboxylate transporter DcuC [Aeromonas jandaei]|uniref:C4-dicarboxylate transporter DcuC n=1 Tax=Aeromonas jandaei TaxID=650 RepID=A0ABD7ERU4_AERJA|nr:MULTISPECIES: C4-dicarboxylate transporter DcuC [Aeromonas]MBL0665182.1 C4-dicarboxylate transporter DcuC [Aeromonas jandaei]MCF5765314.1 C4-dicarboxylate transporter DcuC [Aeromonas veronii]MCX4044218.1 C4-dicarboxylate transporter DcuC [Aeromonas veronii]QNF17522.1 C4-dicarboxylate ABC transporter [Aeromonas jandaei]QQB19007.1 C4-dicarboxylate transporter DcuC [Aeromonas jandaei]